MLVLQDVKKSFREPDGSTLPVLDIPNFQVGEAEQMALIGRSGCGKTTLLHAIAGIRTIDSGRILLGNIDISKLSEHGRDKMRASQLGYVFQTFNLLPAFSAYENVLLGMTFSPKKTDRARALQLLDRVGMSHRLTHKPAALSVGEQQRVAVARALVNRPRLLLADEPTANIDPANQEQVVHLLRETCREDNIAMIMVTHSAEVAAQFERVDKLEEMNFAISYAGTTEDRAS
jgi:putative ABC transport system ATP-binding protein